MEWTTVALQVTTPLFDGGADPDGTAGFRPAAEGGVRAASIRGAMRFWFRALAGSAVNLDLRLLAQVERSVFGGIADQHGTGDAAVPSPLILRLPDAPRQVIDDRFLEHGERAGLRYLLGLGLMRPRTGGADLLRPYVQPGQEFTLRIGFRHGKGAAPETTEAIEVLAFASLWLLCTYGGLGARTRRGLGGLRITGASGRLPDSWKPADLCTPGLDFYKGASWLRPPPATGAVIYRQHFRHS